MKSIEINNLTFCYQKDNNVLSNITLKLSGENNIGIIGSNGAGKSTLLKLLVGLQIEYIGTIKINEIEVNKNTLTKIRKNVGYVFQDSDSQLFMPTVYDDVAFAPRNYGFNKEEVEKMVRNTLDLINIQNIKDRHIYTLSGGQKKLVSIATILSMNPDIILLDEPSITLDPRNRRNLINILNKINGLKLIASHDLDMILDTCEKTILLSEGKIVKYGDTENILKDKKLLEDNGLELPLSLSKYIN